MKSPFTLKTLCNPPPSAAGGVWALLRGLFLLQHKPWTVLWVFGLITIPANQLCLDISTGQQNTGVKIPTLPCFSLIFTYTLADVPPTTVF